MKETLLLTKHMRENPENSHLIDVYEKNNGYSAARKVLKDNNPGDVIEEIKTSNIRGRGGAGFPTGVKWGFLAEDQERYLVINADESEPGTFKDRILLERDPHQLIEGIIVTSFASNISKAFIYIRGEYAKPARRVQDAVEQAYEKGYLGKNIFDSGKDLDVVVHLGAGAYICGEETALLNSLEGRRGEPRLKPPYFPAVKGLYNKPTLVNNVETISSVPWIINNSGKDYAKLGVEGSTGTRIFSLSGHVNNPGNFEIEMGCSFGEFIDTFGNGIKENKAVKAYIPGGASAPWFTGDQLDIKMTIDDVANAGSMLGSGAVVVMDEDTNLVLAAKSIVSFFAHESCGQCTPCREGTTWLEMILDRIASGRGRTSDIDLLLDVCDNISPGLTWPPQMTTICPLGPSAVSPITSLMGSFREEVESLLPKKVLINNE
ncbi:MAG: NADH-quinone oxidoreductase subunit NuoF [Candidatus Poseidoniia archaeon]|jgi:NADH-quinone oxidoreductase subunit F|nr:NADH-quinone oxidoreductase subunit NuoF [Candidatus Poseidoniia archaeon]|tara:strand:+ start:174 stop:1472 length:1299 start_codon:yes stop_codon:yes gene_type:complete